MFRCPTHALSGVASVLVAVAIVAGPLVAQTVASPAAQPAVTGGRRPLSMEDLLSWKGIRSPALSNDGRWMAYILAPNEGDGEFIVRGTAAGAKETRIAIGEPPAGFGAGPSLAISGNNRWVAYTIYPTADAAKKAHTSVKPTYPASRCGT